MQWTLSYVKNEEVQLRPGLVQSEGTLCTWMVSRQDGIDVHMEEVAQSFLGMHRIRSFADVSGADQKKRANNILI